MNIPNNKKRKKSQEQIEKIFLQLIQKKNIDEISVSTICDKANLNRSTFYSNYIDIYDLAEKIKQQMEIESINRVDKLYREFAKNLYLVYLSFMGDYINSFAFSSVSKSSLELDVTRAFSLSTPNLFRFSNTTSKSSSILFSSSIYS